MPCPPMVPGECRGLDIVPVCVFLGFPDPPNAGWGGKAEVGRGGLAELCWERVVSPPGSASLQAEETLSSCIQAQAALVVLGLTSSNDLASSFEWRSSRAVTTFPLVAPHTESPPTPSTARTSGISSPTQNAPTLPWSWMYSHTALNSCPSLQPEARTTLHLSSWLAAVPQHSGPPQHSASSGQIWLKPAM